MRVVKNKALAICIHPSYNMAFPVTHVSKLFKESNISNDGYTSELQSIVSDLLFQMSFTILACQDEEFLVSIFPTVSK